MSINGKRVRTITEEVIPGTVEGSDREPIREPEIQDIDPTVADFLETYGGRDSYVTVHRIAKNGDKEFCGKYETSVFSEEFVKQEHGGGRYEVWLYADLEGSGIRRRGKHSFLIAEPRIQPGAVQVHNPQNDTLIQFMIQQMQNQNMLVLEAIKSIGNGARSGSSIGELTAAMSLLRENSPASGANPLELMKTVLDISEKISKRGGSGAPEDNIYSVIREVGIPLLDKLIPARSEQPEPAIDTEAMNRPVTTFRIPATTENTIEPEKPNPSMPPKTDSEILRALVAELKELAKVNHDVQDIINQIMEADEGENHAYDLLVKGIETYPFTALAMMDADIANTPNLSEWFEKLYNGIRAALRDTDSGGTTGDVSDTSGNGKLGA